MIPTNPKVQKILDDGLTISDLDEILSHVVYHVQYSDYDEFVCNLCGQSHEYWDDVMLHVITEHNGEPIPNVSPLWDNDADDRNEGEPDVKVSKMP
jgi:transcriptional regulator of NAD metabolism